MNATQSIREIIITKIRRHKNHIDGYVLADSQLVRTSDIIQQLASSTRLDIGFAEILECRHGQSRQDAENRDDHEQLDQRERR